MTTIILFFLAVFWLLLMTIQQLGGEMITTPIKGIMLGALYHNESDESYTYHTVQVVLICFSLTFIWNTNV